MLKERKVDWIRDWREEGEARGQAKALKRIVIRQAEKIYGRAKARDLTRLVDSEKEAGKLERIALWLLECDSAEDLMARIRAA